MPHFVWIVSGLLFFSLRSSWTNGFLLKSGNPTYYTLHSLGLLTEIRSNKIR